MAQVKELKPRDLASLNPVISHLVKFPAKKIWTDYDQEADVLYLSFRRPQGATDSEMRDDGIIIHRRGKSIVGVTILDASKR